MTSPPPAPPDLALLVAESRARTQERILAGLLHDLNGPLNNLGLTLTLLERVVEPQLRPQRADDDAPARLRRYLDTLHHEFSRLGAWSRTMSALSSPSLAPSGTRGLREIVAEVHGLLRHYAALAEVRLDALPEGAGSASVTQGHTVREALLATVAGAVALAQPGGHVALEIEDGAPAATLRISIIYTHDGAGRAPARADAPMTVPEADLAAGRALVDALGGTTRLDHTGGRSVVTVLLPRA